MSCLQLPQFYLAGLGFAFLYNICQLLIPNSFQNPKPHPSLTNLVRFTVLSFSLQSATGLSDLMPLSPPARVLAMLQMFCGVMYLALIVTRLIALQYIKHTPKKNSDK